MGKAARIAAFVRSWRTDPAWSSRAPHDEYDDGIECDQCGAWRYPERDATGMLRFFCPNGCECD